MHTSSTLDVEKCTDATRNVLPFFLKMGIPENVAEARVRDNLWSVLVYPRGNLLLRVNAKRENVNTRGV